MSDERKLLNWLLSTIKDMFLPLLLYGIFFFFSFKETGAWTSGLFILMIINIIILTGEIFNLRNKLNEPQDQD